MTELPSKIVLGMTPEDTRELVGKMLDLGWHHGDREGSTCSSDYLRNFFKPGTTGPLCTINVYPRVRRINGYSYSLPWGSGNSTPCSPPTQTETPHRRYRICRYT